MIKAELASVPFIYNRTEQSTRAAFSLTIDDDDDDDEEEEEVDAPLPSLVAFAGDSATPFC